MFIKLTPAIAPTAAAIFCICTVCKFGIFGIVAVIGFIPPGIILGNMEAAIVAAAAPPEGYA